MKKRNLVLSISAVAAASMLFAAPAMAREYKNAAGNITIELPEGDWNEVIDPSAEFVFTNGVDVISAKKYAPDQTVEVARNDEHYNAVLQLSYATGDQLYVLTAQVEDATHLADVYKAVTSIKFSGISVDDEVRKDVNNYSVAATDMTLYVNAGEGLNLRENFSVDSAVLATIPYAEAVRVVGIVQLNGADIGWEKVEYAGMTGYVSSANLVSTKPIENKNPTYEEIVNDIAYNDVMYRADGTPEKIIVLKDGTRLDMNGYKVVGIADGACQMHDGTIIYAFDPTKMSVEDYINGNEPAQTALTLQSATGDGSTAQIFQNPDGTWYDIYGNQFWENEAGVWFNLTDHSEWW